MKKLFKKIFGNSLFSGIIIITVSLVVFSSAAPVMLSVKCYQFDGHDYVSQYDMVNVYNLEQSFDVITQRGKLYRKSSFVVYQIGISAALVNGQLIRADYPVFRNNGEVFIPLDMAKVILASLYQEGLTDVHDNRLFLTIPLRDKIKTVEPIGKNGKNVVPKSSNDRIAFIIIDAGHGGKDPGATGNGVREKDIVLSVGRALEKYLKPKLKDTRIYLSRSDDHFIELGRRTEIANSKLSTNCNGIFVSIHANASISPKIAGFETYFLSQNPTNEEARKTAALENEVIVLEDKNSAKNYNDVDFLEALMLTTQIQKESGMLANCVQLSMDRKISEYKSRGVKKADFFVLRGSLMPAVLVEIGYITNKKECKSLTKSEYQTKIVSGIGDGILDFIRKYNQQL